MDRDQHENFYEKHSQSTNQNEVDLKPQQLESSHLTLSPQSQRSTSHSPKPRDEINSISPEPNTRMEGDSLGGSLAPQPAIEESENIGEKSQEEKSSVETREMAQKSTGLPSPTFNSSDVVNTATDDIDDDSPKIETAHEVSKPSATLRLADKGTKGESDNLEPEVLTDDLVPEVLASEPKPSATTELENTDGSSGPIEKVASPVESLSSTKLESTSSNNQANISNASESLLEKPSPPVEEQSNTVLCDISPPTADEENKLLVKPLLKVYRPRTSRSLSSENINEQDNSSPAVCSNGSKENDPLPKQSDKESRKNSLDSENRTKNKSTNQKQIGSSSGPNTATSPKATGDKTSTSWDEKTVDVFSFEEHETNSSSNNNLQSAGAAIKPPNSKTAEKVRSASLRSSADKPPLVTNCSVDLSTGLNGGLTSPAGNGGLTSPAGNDRLCESEDSLSNDWSISKLPNGHITDSQMVSEHIQVFCVDLIEFEQVFVVGWLNNRTSGQATNSVLQHTN